MVTVADDVQREWPVDVIDQKQYDVEEQKIVDCYGTECPCGAHYCETPGRSRPDEPRGARVVPRGRSRRTQDGLHLHARLGALPALTRDHERDCQPGPRRRPANRHHVDRSASSGHTLAGRDVVRLRRRGPAHRGSGKRQAFPRSAPQTAAAANVAFYPVEPVGVGAPLRRTQQLQSLASETNGAALVNTNDLSGGMKRLASGLSSYYLLGYSSTNTTFDGRAPPDQRQGCEARRRGQCKTDVSRTHRQGSRGSP